MEPEPKTRLARLLRFPLAGLADIPREDRVSVLLLFIFQFGNAGGYVTTRTIADSQFLSQIGPAKLPAMYLVSAGVVALVSFLYDWLVQRASLRRIARRTFLIYAVFSLCFPTLIQSYPGSFLLFASIYVFAQIRGAIGTVQFTTLLNETFGRGRPASVFSVVGMGATTAGFLLGSIVGWLGQRVATENLLYLAAAMDAVAFLPLLLLRGPHHRTSGTYRRFLDLEEGKPKLDKPVVIARVPLLRWIAALACITVLVSTLVEFQWKAAAAEELARDEARLTTYFGYFHAVVFLLTGITQLVFAGRILSRLGVLPTLMALPMAFIAGCVCTLAASAQRVLLWTITLTKGCDVLKRSLNDPGMQLLYAPMSTNDRRRAVAVVLGLVKPSSEALAAIALLIVVPFIGLRELTYVTLVLALLWLGLVVLYQIANRQARET